MQLTVMKENKLEQIENKNLEWVYSSRERWLRSVVQKKNIICCPTNPFFQNNRFCTQKINNGYLPTQMHDCCVLINEKYTVHQPSNLIGGVATTILYKSFSLSIPLHSVCLL